jgi:hypothetical protein
MRIKILVDNKWNAGLAKRLSKRKNMDLFEKLRSVAIQQNQSGEFPSWLLDEILAIADNPDRYGGKEQLIETLVSQISDFDPYAGAGCFNTSVGVATIQLTLHKVNLKEESGQCELMLCCKYFVDNFRHMPETEAYLKENLCCGDYRSCNRFKIYMEFGGENLPLDLDPNDTEAVKKVIQCLRNKKQSQE